MFKTLLHKQLMEIFRSYFYNPKTNKKRSKGAIIAFLLLFVFGIGGMIAAIFAGMAVSLCPLLVDAQLDWFYFATMSIIALLLGTFGSAFSTYSGLYLGKDNDLLLSMPIPVPTIISVRLTGVYILGLFYSGLVMLPTVIVYWVIKKPTVSAIIGCIFLFLLISLLVLVLSCLLGWLVAKISLKLKNKSFITAIISLVAFGAYMFFVNQAEQLLQNFIANMMIYGARIQNNMKAVYLWGRIGTGDWTAITVCTLAVIAITALTWLLLSKTFMSIAISTGKTVKHEYHERIVKQRSTSGALLHKEWKRFLSSANYMLNCGLGVVFIPVFGIVLLVLSKTILPAIQILLMPFPGSMIVILFAVLCVMGSMVNTITPSVSLEGKTLWVVQALPISPWTALKAKLNMQLWLLGIPILFCCICSVIALQAAAESFLLFPLLLAYILFISLLGLLLGLKKPNLNWTSEIVVIKQSAVVAIAMFSGWIYGIAVGGLYFLFSSKIGAIPYLGIVFLITLLTDILLWRWCKNEGSRIFSTL